jgi:hypothetical protein
VTRNLTLHYDRMMLLLDPTPLARGLARKKVEVVNYPDGRFAVQFNGAPLGFKVFDKIQTVQPGAIVDNKRLSAVLGAHQGAAGRLSGTTAARARCAAATAAAIAPRPGYGQGVFEGSGDLPRCVRRGCLATAECRKPASSDRLPAHRSESPTGYSSAGCSPAEPASTSPVTDNSSSIPIRRGNQMRRSSSPQGCRPAFGCDALALVMSDTNGVSSLLCTPGDISILRRH